MEDTSLTNELRKWASTEVPYKYCRPLIAIADRIDVEHTRQLDALYRDMSDAEWVHLPVDADGVPIRVGDVMDDRLSRAFTPKKVREMVLLEGDEWALNFGGDWGWCSMKNHEWCHYHILTVEDVLVEFARECLTYATCVDDHEVQDAIETYAAKLRLAERKEQQ